MLNLGIPELVLILVIALVVFGPGKLPEVGKAIGRGLQEFRQATSLGTAKEEVVREQESLSNTKLPDSKKG